MTIIKSLKTRDSKLSQPQHQLDLLQEGPLKKLPTFKEKLRKQGLEPFRATDIDIFQINLGKMCNQTCKHCHVDAGPDRKEIMNEATLRACLLAIRESKVKRVDLTGGAPEMNPHFFWFVEELNKLGCEIMVRCNLTIILANAKYKLLPEFFAKNRVHVISSLPFYSKKMTDRQRGDGVFEKSIEALKMLNAVGYGKEGTGLVLDLVYNPAGAFFPGDQKELEKEFKNQLFTMFGISFNQLYVITNMPISRFLEHLIESGNLETYMTNLVNAYNPDAAVGVMCRNTVSVGWDGSLYDCDFNQMLEMPVEKNAPKTVFEFNRHALQNREIVTHQHCFGCTAGSGSSCGGATV